MDSNEYIADFASTMLNRLSYDGTPDEINLQKNHFEKNLYYHLHMIAVIESDRHETFSTRSMRFVLNVLLLGVQRELFLLPNSSSMSVRILAAILYFNIQHYPVDMPGRLTLASKHVQAINNLCSDSQNIFSRFIAPFSKLDNQIFVEYVLLIRFRPLLFCFLMSMAEYFFVRHTQQPFCIVVLPLICDAVTKSLSMALSFVPYENVAISLFTMFFMSVCGIISCSIYEAVDHTVSGTVFNSSHGYVATIDHHSRFNMVY